MSTESRLILSSGGGTPAAEERWPPAPRRIEEQRERRQAVKHNGEGVVAIVCNSSHEDLCRSPQNNCSVDFYDSEALYGKKNPPSGRGFFHCNRVAFG